MYGGGLGGVAWVGGVGGCGSGRVRCRPSVTHASFPVGKEGEAIPAELAAEFAAGDPRSSPVVKASSATYIVRKELHEDLISWTQRKILDLEF